MFYGQSSLGSTETLEGADRFEGTDINDRIGESLDGYDIDGDGASEIFIGAPKVDSSDIDAGTVYYIASGTWTGNNSADTEADATFDGVTALDNMGTSFALGDFDADGLGDLLVGAPRNALGGSNAGSAYLFLDVDLATFPASGSWGFNKTSPNTCDKNFALDLFCSEWDSISRRNAQMYLKTFR